MSLLFAGLWPILWKYIVFIGLGGCLLVVAFVPFIWIPMWVRKIALWAGVVVLATTTAYSVGLRDEHRHGVARWNELVDKEIEGAAEDRTAADASVTGADDAGLRDDPDNRLRGAGR